MKIIDDFLSKEDFTTLYNTFLGPCFDWYYNPFVDYSNQIFDVFDLDNYHFVHNFSNDDFSLKSIVKKLNIKELVRAKSNLSTRTEKIIERKFHIDVPDVQTGILYINTNNGWTEFEDGTKVKSVANRLVTFDSNINHRGTTCTDSKVRVVLNLNFKL